MGSLKRRLREKFTVVYYQLHTRTRENSLNASPVGMSVIKEGVQETNEPYNIINTLQVTLEVSGTGTTEHIKLFG
jgi:hypothetical protein